MESWEQLRAQARKIEGDVERALPQLASLAADGDSGAEAQRLLKTVEDHLKALARVRAAWDADGELKTDAERGAAMALGGEMGGERAKQCWRAYTALSEKMKEQARTHESKVKELNKEARENKQKLVQLEG